MVLQKGTYHGIIVMLTYPMKVVTSQPLVKQIKMYQQVQEENQKGVDKDLKLVLHKPHMGIKLQ